MDDQVERLKKLKAGKERLAAFQKKKTKKKKKSDTSVEESDSSPQQCPSQPPSPECGSPAGAGAVCPPVQPSEDADPPNDHQIFEEMTDLSSDHYLNETEDFTDEVNQSLSESERQNLFQAARMELRQASSKISELEESVLGKQRALERLGLEIQSVKSENERLKQETVISNSQMNSYDHLEKCKPGCQRDQILRIQELENAIVKRDELLRQLSSRLQISVQEAADKGLQQVCSAETQKLAQQVQLLQLQLQQAGEKLNGQMKQHCVSAQALQDAKNEILNLQLVIQQKDEMMSQLVQKLSQVNEDYVQLQSSTAIAEQQMIDHQELLKQLNALKERSDSLSQNLDEERQKNKQLEKQLKDENLMLMHNAHDEPIAVEDQMWAESSSISLSQPGKESTLIQELNCEKSKNQALDLQLQNQFHLIEKFISLYHSDDTSDSTREEFNIVLHQLTELIDTLSKNYSSTWSQHLPNLLKSSSFQDFECQVDLWQNDKAGNSMSSESDNDSGHLFSQMQELELKLKNLQSENQDLSTEIIKSKSNFNVLLATKDELEKQYQAAEASRFSIAETVQGYVDTIQGLKEENASLSASISNLEKLLSTQSEEAGHALEAETLLNNELTLLKSEKDMLNLSLQKKDEDIQVLSEKLELSYQEVMNLKNMKRTLEQELSGSQDENVQLKEQLDLRATEADQLKVDEKVLAEKLAASQAEINRLNSEIESVIDESSKHQKTVENETVKLREVIADYRQQIDHLQGENSEQMKKALDQENRLLELDQQIISLTHAAKSAEMNNEKLSEENNAYTKKTLCLVQYFCHLQSLLSVSNSAQQGDIAYQLSADDNPEKFGGIVSEVSSAFGKHKERIDQLELENNSLMNACIQEKEDIEKRMKEKSNEIIIYQQTIEQSKQRIEALQSENQTLTNQLQVTVTNARKNESELERLQAQVDILQMGEAEREHFKELDQLLISREEEIERLKTEMDSFTRNFEKENENQRQVISELNEQIAKKEEVEERNNQELKAQKDLIESLQRLVEDEAEEVKILKEELLSVRNMKESSSLALQEKEDEIQKLQENVAMLNSQCQDQLHVIRTVKSENDVMLSEIDHLKSKCSSMESQFQKEKSELDQMLSEKNRLDSENVNLREDLTESQKLISEMENHYRLEKEKLVHQNDALSLKLEKLVDEKKCLKDRCDQLDGERDQEVSKMDAELSALKVLLKTHKEESVQKLKEVENKLQDAEKQICEWEQKVQQLKSEQSSVKAGFKKQIEKMTKEKQQQKAKVEELLALSQQKEEQGGQLTALMESKSSELKQANDELGKLKELWQVEKAELCSKMDAMSISQDEYLEEVKKLKEANSKLSEEKSKLNNSLKELEKKSHSKEKSLSDKNSKLQNTIKELKQKSKEKSLSEENSKLQNSLKELKQKLANTEKALSEEKSKLQDSLKELEQKSLETEKVLSEENAKLKESLTELNEKLLEMEKVSDVEREKNLNSMNSNPVSKETASLLTSACDGGQSERNDEPLYTKEELLQKIEENETDLAKKQEFELDALAEKYERDLKYARLDILQELADEKDNYERDLEQKYTLKVESLKAETDRSFIKSLQKIRSEMESKHREEVNEMKVSLMKECLQMAPHELESRIGNMLHDMQVKNQSGGLLEKYQAKKLAESRDSLLQQIELLNTQYEQIQDEQFTFPEKFSKKPVASSPRIRRKFDTLPQDIESASRSLVELSRAKGCHDEEKSCCRLDCQGYRKRYEIALKILTEKGLTSLDNMSEKSSFEVDSLDGSTSVGDQQRDELSQELQDEYNELMERTMTEPVISSCFSVKHSPEAQCSHCIAHIDEKLSLKKRLSIQLELFGKERFLLQNRSEHLSVELENALLMRDQLQKELNIVKEMQQSHNSLPAEIEFTQLKVKLANTEDQVAFLRNKVSQNEIERQELKTKINDLFVKLIDQQHYIDTLEEEYSRSRSAWHHKGTMTCEDHTSVLPVRELEPGLNRRHSDPNTSGQYIHHIDELYRPKDNRISKSVGNLSPVDDISLEPAMWLPKIPRSQRDTSPDSLNKSPFSDHSSQPEEIEYYKGYCPERTGSSLSEASTLLTGDIFVPNSSTPQRLSRATHSSPSLTTLGEFHESDRIFSSFDASDKENLLPFSGKHLELIDEVAELKHSLAKTKEKHIQETAILKEFIDQLQQFGPAEKTACGQSEMKGDGNSSTEIVSLSSDVVDLRQKLSLLRETCQKLTEDNGELMKKLYDQECLVMKTKYLGNQTNAVSNSDELDAVFGKQLLLLQKHRDELSLKLCEERSLENQITELVAGRAALEQTLCKEREMKEVCVYKKGLVDSELTSLKAEYERVLQEQLCLEQVIRDKDLAEQKSQVEKFDIQQQLSNLACKLEETEKIIKDMREKELPETSTDDQYSEKNLIELRSQFSQELYDAKSTIEKQNIQRLEGLRKDMEEQHALAIEYLRQQLRSDFKLRESRLEEHHAAHIASLHTIHGEQLQSLKDEYEAQMEELKQELHKERFKHVDSSASNSSGTELNGLLQAEQQKQEEHTLVLDNLRDVLSAPEWQQLQTLMQEIKQQHQIELNRVKSQCEDEIDLRVKAARLTVEQVYKSQSELMKASLEEKKQSELAELRDTLARYHNEEISRRETEWGGHLEKLQAQYDHQIEIGQEPAPKGAVGTLEGASLVQNLTKRLNEEHKKLIEVISKEANQRDQFSSYQSPTQPALHAADSLEFLGSTANANHDGQSNRLSMSMSDDSICRCLEDQKEEIVLLRSKILKEYEQLLKARTDSMVIESRGDISRLQDEIEALQRQYEIQIASLKQDITEDATADTQDNKNLSQCLDTDQQQTLHNLLEYFKSKVHSIESRFNNQITGLKTQIESDLSASFGEASCEVDDSFQMDNVPLTSTERSSSSGQNLIFPKINKENSSGRHSLGKSACPDRDSQVTNLSDKSGEQTNSSEDSCTLEKDIKVYQEEIEHLRHQLEEVITSKTFLQREKEELVFAHAQALSGQEEDFEHKHKMDIEDLQSEFDIQLQVELKKQAVELLEKYQSDTHESNLQNRRESFERELVKRTMTAGHFDSYDAGDSCDITDSPHKLDVPGQKFGYNKSPNQIISDYEARISQMKVDLERNMESLRVELTEMKESEMEQLISKHQMELQNVRKQLTDVEEKFETVMEGLRTGDAPEVAKMMRDKYDTELELAKALMQQEFDESLEGEQSRLQDHHDKLIEDLLVKKTSEMRELQQKYNENLSSLQKMLQFYEQQRSTDDTDGSEANQILTDLKHQLQEKDNKMAEELAKHKQEMEKLQREYEEKLAQLKNTNAPDRHADQTASIARDVDTIKSELDAAHQVELNLVKEELSSEHAKMIENLEKQHQMQIEELQKEHKVQLEELQKETADKNGKNSQEKKDVPVQSNKKANSLDLDASQAETEASDVAKTADQDVILEANQNLLRHLSNLVRSYLSIEDTINKKLHQVLSGSKTAAAAAGPSPSESPPQTDHLNVPGNSSSSKRRRKRFRSADRTPPNNETSPRVNRARSMDPVDPRYVPFPGVSSVEECSSSGDDFQETSITSSVTDEGLVLSQQFSDSIIFTGPTLDSESIELITDTSSRLQSSIMRLLEMMEETTQQLLESKTMQQELLDSLRSKDGDVQNLNQRLQEMSEQLKQEINSREHLALELHKSQGLVEGFSEERDQLSTRLKDLEDREAVLVMENETLRNKLHDLQMSESEVKSLHQEVQRQQTILYDNAGREHQGLLDEICQLNDDKRHMMQLLQQNQDNYETRIRDLITSEEDLEHKYTEMLDEKRQQIDDLRLQLESAERQLKANKQFLNEQAQEREQEREEFQREIHKWKSALQQIERQQNAETRLKKEVEELSDQLESRITSQNEILLKNDQLERDLQDKKLTAQELKNLVSQLEQELDEKNTFEKKLNEKISQLEYQLQTLQVVNNELSDELKTSLPKNEEKITELENQLEDQELVYRKKAMTLDEELKKAHKIEEELSSEKTALEQQVCDQLLQIASFKNQLDDYRQRSLARDTAESTDGSNPLLDELRTQLQRKEEEVSQLTDMVDKLELELVRKDNQLGRLEMATFSREPLTSQSSVDDHENSKVLLMKEENQKLKSQVSTLQRQVTTAGFSSLAQQLLDEKNEQIDQLKEQLAQQNHYNSSDDAYSERNCLKEELEKKTLEIEEKDAEICSLQHMINSFQHGSSNISGEHFPGDVSLPFHQEPSFLEDSISDERTSLQQELSAVLTDRDNQIDSLQSQLKEKEEFVDKIQMESVLEHQQAIDSLQEALQDKDITLDQMYVEVDGLHAEVANLTEHQTKLQEDFDTVQAMLENKEKEIESLTKELTDVRSQMEKSQIETDVAVRYEVEIEKLKKKVKELENTIEEKMEENYTLNEKVEELENFKSQMEKMKSELQEKEKQLANKVSVTQGMEKRIESSNKVIRQLQEREDHWHVKYTQTELQLREREEHLHQLQNELLERDETEEKVRQRLIVAEQQLNVQQQNIQTLQMQIADRDKRFKEYNETSSELRDTISSLEEEKEQMALRMSTKDQEIPKLQEQLARLQKIAEEQSADISRREKSYMTLVKLHQEKDEMISMEEGRTVVLREEIEELQNELLKKDEELSKALEELHSLKNPSEEQRNKENRQEDDGSCKTDIDSSALQKLVSQQNKEIEQLQSELETLKDADQQKSRHIAQLEDELEERLSEIKTLASNMEHQKHQLDQFNTKAEKLQEELQETWKSKLAGESQIDELRQRLFKLDSEELKTSSSLDDSHTIQSKFTDLWSEIQKRESDVERLECELSDVHHKLRSQEAEILHTHLQTAQDGGQLSKEISILLGKLQQLESELESKNKLISCYELQLNKKDDVLQDMQVKLDQTLTTYQHNEQEYHTLLGEEQKQASMAEGRIIVLRSEVEELQKELLNKENELRGVKDHLMETQGQLLDRAQEMTRLCQRRSSSDEQDENDSVIIQSSMESREEQKIVISKVSENTVEMLEEELKMMRAQLQARTKQLEEANHDEEPPSVDNTALPHDQLIEHVNQVQDELRITRGVLERLCKANSAQQATLQEREQQVQQLQADLAAILAQQKAALADEAKSLQKGDITWQSQSFESPEFHNVGPRVQSSDNRGAPSAVQDARDSHPPEQNIQDRLQILLNRMHREGLQNLSLAELQFIRQYASPKPNPKDIDIQALRAAWEKERQSLLSAIQALKDLLAHEQQITGSQWQSGMFSVDWRSKILQALSHVFTKERNILLSELHSYVLSSEDGAMELSDIQRLENKIQTQANQQKAAMEQVVNADRQSLLSELQDCKAKTAIMELQYHEENQELSEKLTNLERQMGKREEQSQRHIQLLEYRLQQSRIVHDDLQSSLEMERKRAAELAMELTKAKTQSLDMHNECTNLQVNLAKVKDALEQEHSRYLSLMAALEEEKVKTAELTEQLDQEKGKVHDLEVEVENLNGQVGQERDLEFQHLHLALENERDKLKDAEDVAREKQNENLNLQQELETERLHNQSLIAKHEADLAHMKSRLQENEAYMEQLTGNLDKVKELNVQLKQSLDNVCIIRQDTSERDRASITDLQNLLEAERSQLKDLHQQMETMKLESEKKILTLTSELQASKEKLEKEKTKSHKLQVKSDITENQHSDIERQLNYEKERAIRLQAEKHTLAIELQNVRQREKERYVTMENEKMANNKKLKEMARFVDNNKVAMHQNELEVQRLQEKVQALETDLQNSRLRERQLVHEMEYSKLRSPLHLENMAAQAHLQKQDEGCSKSDSSKREKILSAYKSQLENIRQHLEFNGIKIQDLLNKSITYVKSSHNAQSSEAFAILRPLVTTIGDLLSDLRQLQLSLTLEKEGPGYPHLSAMVNQRTLQHNRQLINSIFTLSEEKLSLREQLLKLEERICDYKNREVVQQTQAVDEQGMSFLETSFSVERMKWEQERTSYELALQNAEKKIEQLQRNLRIERSQGLAASGTNPWVADKDLVQSLYQKYLRAESFRKALIYQKNYLLVLLGGFQDSEQTVLALLAQMGATDNSPLRGGEPRRPGRLSCRRPLTMFRSVARAAIAISRMKFLVRKLQQVCATPLPAALMLGPPALTQQRSGYTASESSSTSSTTSSSSHLTSSKTASPQDTSPRLALNQSLVMQGGARARSPPNHNTPATGRLLPIPGLLLARNQSTSNHSLKNSRSSLAFNTIQQPEDENESNLETQNPNASMMNARQLCFTTPPTKEVSHVRGTLQRVPAIQQLSFDHSSPLGQRTLNDSPVSSSEGALIANPCPSNGDIPNNDNFEEPNAENRTSQDDFLHCIERVQNRVDQLRHPPQIERQRHRRKYDGFHKNVDL